MISVTRINGTELWINPGLIETVESTPDSVVTLTNGHKYIIRETPKDVSNRIIAMYRQIGLMGLLGDGGKTPREEAARHHD